MLLFNARSDERNKIFSFPKIRGEHGSVLLLRHPAHIEDKNFSRRQDQSIAARPAASDVLLKGAAAFAMSSLSNLTYEVRASKHRNPLAQRLFRIAEQKKSNVVISADVTTSKDLLDLAEGVHIFICILSNRLDG